MKKKELSELKKAREHFVKGTTEWLIGTGFAIKGLKRFLEKEKGRKFAYGLTVESLKKGVGLVGNLAYVLFRSGINRTKGKSKRRSRKARKIKVE
jgi:hypothetical protein